MRLLIHTLEVRLQRPFCVLDILGALSLAAGTLSGAIGIIIVPGFRVSILYRRLF